MQAIVTGESPPAPMAETLAFALVEVSEGRAVFRGEPGPEHLNPMGGVHGGLALTLIDSATGCAVHTTLPEGKVYGSLETKANFVRGITPETGPLLAIGEVVHRGGRVCTAEARVVGESDGKLYAHGTSTCLIL